MEVQIQTVGMVVADMIEGEMIATVMAMATGNIFKEVYKFIL